MTQPTDQLAALPGDRAALRAMVKAHRNARDQAMRQADDRARTVRLMQLLEARSQNPKIATYLSTPPEPDSCAFVSQWGARVLVPVLGSWSADQLPRWAWWQPGEPVGMWRNIPTPSADPVEADELSQIDVVIVSALLADQRGYRLGVGGGWFDRALPQFRPDALRVCLLNDDEVVDELAIEPWDVAVDVLVTPSQTIWTGPGQR